MRFFKNTLATLTTQGGTFLLGMVFSVMAARLLGPDGRAVLSLVFLITAMGTTLTGFGLCSANIYLLHRKHVPMGTLAANTLIITFVSSAVAAAIVLVSWSWLSATVLPGVSPTLAAIGVAVIPLALLGNCALSFLQSLERFVQMKAVALTSQGLSLLVLIVTVVGLGMGVKGAVIAQILAATLTLLLAGFALRTGAGRKVFALRPSFRVFRRTLAYGLREHLSNLGMFLSYRIDMFFLAAFLGVREVGYYVIAVMGAEMFLYLPKAVSTVLAPRIAKIVPMRGAEDSARTTRVVSFLVGAGILMAMPLAPTAIRIIFSEAYLPAAPAFVALLPGIYALSISRLLSRYFTAGLGEPGLNARAAMVTLAVNLPLNLLLIPAYGIVGAAVASSVAYTAHAIVTLTIFRRRTGIPLFSVLLPQGQDVAWIWGFARTLRPLRWRESEVVS